MNLLICKCLRHHELRSENHGKGINNFHTNKKINKNLHPNLRYLKVSLYICPENDEAGTTYPEKDDGFVLQAIADAWALLPVDVSAGTAVHHAYQCVREACGGL